MRLRVQHVSAIGLDLGLWRVCAVQLERAGRWRVSASVSFDRKDPGSPLDPAEASRIAEVLRRHGFTGKRAVLMAQGRNVACQTIDIPLGNQSVTTETLARLELARSLECDPRAVEVGSWKLPAESGRRGGEQLLAFGAAHNKIDAMVSAVESAGFEVVGVEPRPAVLARACSSLARSGPGVVVSIDEESLELSVLMRGLLVYVRRRPNLGLETLAGQIADAAGTPIGQAMRELYHARTGNEGQGTLTTRLAATRIEAFDRAIATEITEALAYASRRFGDDRAPWIAAVGAGAKLPGVVKGLEAALRGKVQTLSPATLRPCHPMLESVCQDPAQVAALGLAAGPLSIGSAAESRETEVAA